MSYSKTSAPVIIAAGGTGGHVYPALSVAQELICRKIPVVWVGTQRGLEARLVPDAKIEIEWLDIVGLRGKGAIQVIVGFVKLIAASIQAGRILLRHKPRVVLGMGGYVAGPVGVVAKLLGFPLVLHEQNAIPGLTNRLLAKIANRVLQAFPDVFSNSSKVFTVGNPVRKGIVGSHREVQTSAGLNVLVIGGSLGARFFNETMPKVFLQLSGEHSFWHQTGDGNDKDVLDRYVALNIDNKVRVENFIDDMQAALEWADVTVCRAGAMTVSELAVSGMPSILVPFPYAVDDHQTVNAQFLKNAEAAIIVKQSDNSIVSLINKLEYLSNNRLELSYMSDNARKLAILNVGEKIADHLLEVAA